MYPKLQLALWLAHPALELAVAITMVVRGLHRRFPVFLSYLLFEFVAFSILFPMRHALAPYFYGYWSSAMISLVLGFMVIYEIFTDVFRPYHTLRDLGTVLFKWAALVMIFVAVVVAVASPAGKSPLMQAVSTVQRCVRTIQCGLILFLLFFTRYLGVSWRKYSFGIALGFGSYAAVELASNALYCGGQLRSPFVGFCNTVMYTLTLMIWFGYSFLKAPASAQAQAGLLASQRWEESLSDLHRPAPADSLIPMFEGMVDRAFSHSSLEGEVETQETQETLVPQSLPLNPVAATFALRRAASQR